MAASWTVKMQFKSTTMLVCLALARHRVTSSRRNGVISKHPTAGGRPHAWTMVQASQKATSPIPPPRPQTCPPPPPPARRWRSGPRWKKRERRDAVSVSVSGGPHRLKPPSRPRRVENVFNHEPVHQTSPIIYSYSYTTTSVIKTKY